MFNQIFSLKKVNDKIKYNDLNLEYSNCFMNFMSFDFNR